MLVGLISDVHSNATALMAVLSEMDNIGVEKILHAGDIIGYNPYPNETIEIFIENKIISILGNHDRAIITGDVSDFNPYAAAALVWTKRVLSQEHFGYIQTLKNREQITKDNTILSQFMAAPGMLTNMFFR